MPPTDSPLIDSSLALLTAEVRRRFSAAESAGETLGDSLKLDFGPDGIIHVDGTVVPLRVSNEDKDAACTIRIELANFRQLLDGELDATSAFLQGLLKVEGAMGVALKLQSALG
jgi:putative sterol carrier protein